MSTTAREAIDLSSTKIHVSLRTKALVAVGRRCTRVGCKRIDIRYGRTDRGSSVTHAVRVSAALALWREAYDWTHTQPKSEVSRLDARCDVPCATPFSPVTLSLMAASESCQRGTGAVAGKLAPHCPILWP